MTFLSIAALALATATSWWPQEAAGGGGASTVQVQTDDGQTACGELAESSTGTMRVQTDAHLVTVSLDTIASIAPVSSC